MNQEELLAKLHEAVSKELLDRILAGEASAADIGNAIKFLKDNGISAVPKQGSSLKSLVDSLPDLEFNNVLPFDRTANG